MASRPPRDAHRLPPESLRWTCDPTSLGFATTGDLPAAEADTQIVGQTRAVRALQFGLGMDHPGYNVFVNGPSGTGRHTYTRAEVEQAARGRPVPADWIYVRNFASASEPVAISLPPGRGRAFRRDVDELITEVREGLRRTFASEAYERQRAEAVQRYEQQVAEIWQALERQARVRGLALQRMPTGIITVPVDLQGRPVTEEVFRALPEVERRTAQYVIEGPIGRLREAYGQIPKVAAFLDAAEQDMLEHLSEIIADREEDSAAASRQEIPMLPRRDPLAR